MSQAVQGQSPTPYSGFQDLTQGMFKNYCWSYDAWGNRTDEEGSNSAYSSNAGGASACSSQPQTEYNANNQIVGSGAPSYDAAGDVTSDPSGVAGIPGKQPTDLRYLYDAEGRICAVGAEGGSVMTGYVYDADGNRVAKGPITSWSCDPTTNGFESSGNETNYVLNQSGQIVTETTLDGSGNAQWVYTNVYANGSLFATYNAQGLHFLLNDWLGTRRASVNASGTVESFCASLPYGDDLICSGALDTPNEQHFTGKTHDQESGNDYFGARYYAENEARFMSPDWSAKVEPVPYAKLDNPQSLNLYTYMLDNPLSGVDPDGHCSTAKNASANTACQNVQNLSVNNAMEQYIKLEEGLLGTNGKPALQVYLDRAKNPTVGWGHKVTAADHLRLGEKITKAQAEKFFKSDLAAKESAVRGVLESSGHQFSQGEFNALVDLTYNGGPGMLTMGTSPNLMNDINSGNYQGMYGQLRYTLDSAGNFEPGLVTRSDQRQAIAEGADPDSQ